MTRTTRRLLWSLALAFAVAGAAVVALALRGQREPPGMPRAVPESWNELRTGPGHRKHVEDAHIACRDCHDFEREGFKNPGAAPCAGCHAKEASVHHRGGSGADATDCLTCHAFRPDVPAPTCASCHGRAHGDRAAIGTHATTDCTKCHRPHESPSVVPADCTTCHEERAPDHAAHAGSAGCADCHRGHRPAAEAIALCSSCHAEPAGPRPAGHASCVGCHRPHVFEAGGARACIGCHGAKVTLASQVPAHADCTSCHTPHAPRDAAASCVHCHADVRVEHGSGGACITCHAPHRDDPARVATPCTECHAPIAPTETGAHAGGIACEECHEPHAFGGRGRQVLCPTCHASEIARTQKNLGHARCETCHGSALEHAPGAPPACESCHAAEHASAPAGHQRCQGCHDPH
ncbi:MAG: hypothetical protein FWD17_13045, partial [Polyangiaceae bacterium]|nr:hypothetical protein [Polyangiaceae bacterium]